MLIWSEILIIENPLLVTCSHLQGELCLGNLNCKSVALSTTKVEYIAVSTLLQKCLALSTTEVEYIAKMSWHSRFLSNMRREH